MYLYVSCYHWLKNKKNYWIYHSLNAGYVNSQWKVFFLIQREILSLDYLKDRNFDIFYQIKDIHAPDYFSCKLIIFSINFDWLIREGPRTNKQECPVVGAIKNKIQSCNKKKYKNTKFTKKN